MRFGVGAILYVFALLAAGMTAFGPIGGALASAVVLALWASAKKPTVLGCLAPVVILVLLIPLLLPALQSAREAARRAQCMNHMKQIALALLNYETATGRLPPAYLTDADGKPMHSWRVLILPYMGAAEQKLYNAYDFDEPWDGPNNSKLADQMPAVYRCPSCDACAAEPGNPLGVSTGGCTNYFVVAGDETALQPERGVRIQDVTDGMSNTITLIDCAGKHVNWMAPEDLTMDEAAELLSDPESLRHVSARDEYFVTRYLTGGGNVARLDGSTLYAATLPTKDARALLTIAGGETIGADTNLAGASHTALVTVHWARVFSFSVFVGLAVAPVFRRRENSEQNGTAPDESGQTQPAEAPWA